MRLHTGFSDSSPDTLLDYLDRGVDIVDMTSSTPLRLAVGRRWAACLDGLVTAKIQHADPRPEDLYPLARGCWAAVERALRKEGFRLEDSDVSREAVEGDMPLFRRIAAEALKSLPPHHAIADSRGAMLSERFRSQGEQEAWRSSKRKTPVRDATSSSHRGLVLATDHAAVQTRRSVFAKSVGLPDTRTNIFMPGANNIKLGSVVRSGELKGLPIFQLTFEERATCPPCTHLLDCYGNNMPFARRIDTGALSASELHAWIERSVVEHTTTFPRWVLYRLHTLGDFTPDRDIENPTYARYWLELLRRFPTVRVFGYTHVPYDSPVGEVIRNMNELYPERAFIRFSNQSHKTPLSTVSLKHRPDTPTVRLSGEREATVCRAQLADVKCSKCALCFSRRVNSTIWFVAHASL